MIRVVIDDTKVQTPVRLMILIRLNDVMNLLQGALTPMILDVHEILWHYVYVTPARVIPYTCLTLCS